MWRYIHFTIIALLLTVSGLAQSYGLAFNSHEVVQEKRTCLDLSPEDSLCFSKNFELGFDISFIPGREIYFGYVIRVITNNQNIDLIYNQRSRSFQVIIGENFSGISFTLDSLRLMKEWYRFTMKCDLVNHTMRFGVNGKTVGTSPIPPLGNCFRFLWGANDFPKYKTRDIPPMKIKDIKLTENDVLKYSWPLDELKGDNGYDQVNKRIAKVKNPVWLKPKYQKWDLVSSFTINDYAAVAYDAKHDRLFVTGSDSLAICSFRNEQHPVDWIPSRHQELLVGHQATYDTISDKLYDFFVDRKIITSFDFTRRQWDLVLSYAPITEFWHANKFINVADTSLYVIGGYGQLKYKNLVQHYRFNTRKWDTLKAGGDYFPPRYLAALGTDPQQKSAYIIGGYGSQTGDQMLDPRNYYDLFRYDIKQREFKKIYTLKTLTTPFVFANSLVIGPKQGAWYGMIFANDSYSSSLQLVEGSLTDSSYRPVGNLLPYSFYDIQSFADLYYSPLSNKLIAVTLLYTKPGDRIKNTEVKIYSLNFPPEAAGVDTLTSETKDRHNYFYIIGLAGLFAAAAIFFVLRRKPRKAAVKTSQDTPVPVTDQPGFGGHSGDPGHPGIGGHHISGTHMEKEQRSAIYLFGPFQVFDKEGHDITRLFTPLLKELFLIIVIYTIRNGRGISSESLNEILWHDKPEKDAKNNRSVNLAKLKVILEKIGNGIINKESGYWQFAIPDEDIYVDYKKYVSLLQEASDAGKGYIHPLVDIIKRGAFLSQTEYNWLDDIKSDISNSVLDCCLGYIKSVTVSKDPEFIIEISNCIFYFDQVNEDALTYKCKSLILLKRHTLANNTYLKFLKEYKDIYGTDLGKSFQEIIA